MVTVYFKSLDGFNVDVSEGWVLKQKVFRLRSLRSSAALKCIRWNLTDVSRKVAFTAWGADFHCSLSSSALVWFWELRQNEEKGFLAIMITRSWGVSCSIPERFSLCEILLCRFTILSCCSAADIATENGLINHQKEGKCWWIAICSKNVRNSALPPKMLVQPYCL